MTDAPKDAKPLAVPPLVLIPFATLPDQCEGCGATIYFVGRQPISIGKRGPTGILVGLFEYQGRAIQLDDVRAPDVERRIDGVGFNHFADCPQRAKFARGKGGTAPSAASLPPMEKTPAEVRESQDAPALAGLLEIFNATKKAGVLCCVPGCHTPIVLVVHAGRHTLFGCEGHGDELLGIASAAGYRARYASPLDYMESDTHPEWREPFIKRAAGVREHFRKLGAVRIPPASTGERRDT